MLFNVEISFLIKLFINIFILLPYFLESFIEYKKIENYLVFCNNNIEINEKFHKIFNPEISVISPVYNREKYLSRFIRSIQNQSFKNIELIFIDDFSCDNTVKLIKEYQKRDERISLIKHTKNKGTFISRNIGALYSNSQYIILPDPDDILSKNILKDCFNIVKKYNFEMIRFNIYIGNSTIFVNENIKNLDEKPIYQPELSTYLFYGKGILCQIDYNLSNKFIKREAYIRALNSLNNNYLNTYLISFEDGIMNYILFRTIKSFLFIKRIGYFYLVNNDSITKNFYKINKINLKFMFIYLKIIFEYSKNTKYEKDMANFLLNDISHHFYIINNLSFLDKEIKFYNDIINIYMNCKFISNLNKKILKNFTNILKKRKIKQNYLIKN